MIITIDGPSASGKSSVARAVARRLGYYYLNSGMLYRGLAYCLIHRMQVSEGALASYENFSPCLATLRYSYDNKTDRMTIMLDGENVTATLKTPQIDKASSLLGNNKQARIAIMHLERKIAQMYDNISVDGRDCGSLVFPNAEHKFYLTAALAIRAQRWQADQEKQGNKVSLEQAKAFLAQRDKNDSERSYAPLIVPEGAITVDSSHLDLAQTEQIICDYIQKR